MNYFVHPQLKFSPKNLLCLLFCLLKNTSEKDLENIKKMFPGKTLYFTDMGRTAFRLIIEQFNLQNSKMLVPAYLCDIFFPLFQDYNITPIFVDIDKETFNINPETAKQGAESILLVHTYGKKAEKETQGLVIEDCAHALGNNNFNGPAFFSLYKLFPALRGGLAVLPNNNQNILLKKTKFSFRDFISLLNCFNFFAFLFKKFANEIAPKHIRKEKMAELAGLNRVCLNIFLWQSKNMEATLTKRKELALLFQEELRKMGFSLQSLENNSFTFLSALTPKNLNRDDFVKRLRKKGIFPTRIWHMPIILNPEAQKEYNIDISNFPNTLEVSKRIINFPIQNFYTKKDIEKMSKKISLILKELLA